MKLLIKKEAKMQKSLPTKTLFLFLILTVIAWTHILFAGNSKVKLEKFNGGFFSIDKPKKWNIVTAGNCGSFAFLIIDPSIPLRQIFYFGEVGPVYLNAQQKQIDQQYVRMGGYPVGWIDMPIINPLTPEGFLSNFHIIAESQAARQFMPSCPKLENIKIVSRKSQPSLIPGGSTELLRALFTKNGKLGEGLFLLTVAPMLPYTGNPGGGIGYGFMFTGITAPKNEFKDLENTLVNSIKSFWVNQNYVNNCLRQQATTYAGILKAGKTLKETSDIIMKGWQKRNKTEDIISEKWSDGILGTERLYNPTTGEVFEFDNGFYDKYNLNRDQYEMNNLKPLPDNNYDLWMTVPMDGHKNIK
jgi:hypothetical protein